MRRTLPALALLLCAATAQAQQLVRDGSYVVHYAALNTSDLSADIAQHYGIRRAAGRGLLIINAQHELATGKSTVATAARAQGTVRSLLGDVQTLSLRRVQTGGTDDLLAEFDYTPLEFLYFDLQVQPQGAPRGLTVKFQQQFFGND